MEKVTEIDTLETDSNAFEVLVRCKEMANSIDLANVILDTTCIDEKEMLIRLIESIRNLELEVIEVQVPFIPEVQA